MPAAVLHVVATPIGNLGDLSPRARQVLAEVAAICAEDTRRSGQLLAHFGIATPLLALHEHNEQQLAQRLVARLLAGESLALVSDAGTPLVSDPGFRAVRAARFREFMHLLPNGFSYPTTSTMAFFRSAYPVAYVPVPVARRVGTASHIRPLKDGIRFLLIIFKIATLYSPLKLFEPIAAAFFLTGLGYYGYTFATEHRLTNMSTLLFSASVIIFLIGLVSEQITSLMYRRDS